MEAHVFEAIDELVTARQLSPASTKVAACGSLIDSDSTSVATVAAAAAAGATSWSSLHGGDSLTLVEETSVVLWTYIGSLVLAVGLLGHVAVCAVTLADRKLRERSIAVHIVALSAAGVGVMLLGLLNNVVWHATRFEVSPRTASATAAGCRLHAALTYFALQWYSWMQALVAAERLICVQWPTRYRTWCTRKRNALAAAAAAAFLLSLDVVVAVAIGGAGVGTASSNAAETAATLEIDEKVLGDAAAADATVASPLPLEVPEASEAAASAVADACAAPAAGAGADLFYGVWVWIDLCAYCLAPAAAVIACNTRSALLICRAKTAHGSRLRRVSAITATLLGVNALFVCSTLPVSVLYVLPSPVSAAAAGDGEDSSTAALDYWWSALNLLQYAGCGLSGVAYFLGVPKFRRALLAGALCRCRPNVRCPRGGGGQRSEGGSDTSCGPLTVKTTPRD